MIRIRLSLALLAVVAIAIGALTTAGGAAPGKGRPVKARQAAALTSATFSIGQPQANAPGAPGCGSNPDGEPTAHVSAAGNVFVGSERGLGGGSDGWVGLGQSGGASAQACAIDYAGQPNAVAGFGASGGDIDSAWAGAPGANGNLALYVASLNLGSVSVAHSTDNGATFTNVPVQGGLPGDDREWIAAFGANTSLLTFHDIATDNIDVLRSDNGGNGYIETSQAIPITDYKAMNNELGNIAIDRRNTAGATAGQFWAYQAFVAASTPGGSTFNEAFLAVTNDGGATWTDRPIPCSAATGAKGLDHNFPNVSVAPDGTIWYAWSNDTDVFTATSSDHGATWTCSPAISTNTTNAIFPWLAATSNGVDLVFYGAPSGVKGTWYVYFAQDPTSTATGWAVPQQIVSVHTGAVCEGGISCTGGRQLLDDFAVDTDQAGWAHIAFSHDAPNLGGSGTFTGYAVQTGGTQAGFPN
jgi:hypothetical protein